jgi:hypothetical protein
MCGDAIVGAIFIERAANVLKDGLTPEQLGVKTTATCRNSGRVTETLQKSGNEPQRLAEVRPAELAENEIADKSFHASVAVDSGMDQIHEPVSSSKFGMRPNLLQE